MFSKESRNDARAASGLILRSMKGVLSIAGPMMVGLALLVSFGIDLANTSQGGAVDRILESVY